MQSTSHHRATWYVMLRAAEYLQVSMGTHPFDVEHLQGGDVWAGGQPGGRQTTENQQSTQHGERHNDYIRGRSEAWVGAALLYTAQILAEIRRGYVRTSRL